MKTVTLRVEHALGRAEAMSRIRKAAEGLTGRSAAFVKSIEWSDTGASVVGEGFQGRLTVNDTDVVGEVELGWALAFLPLKVQRDGEAWIGGLLR
jgi:hypothetical protein